jgi:hypothetical protein
MMSLENWGLPRSTANIEADRSAVLRAERVARTDAHTAAVALRLADIRSRTDPRGGPGERLGPQLEPFVEGGALRRGKELWQLWAGDRWFAGVLDEDGSGSGQQGEQAAVAVVGRGHVNDQIESPGRV